MLIRRSLVIVAIALGVAGLAILAVQTRSKEAGSHWNQMCADLRSSLDHLEANILRWKLAHAPESVGKRFSSHVIPRDEIARMYQGSVHTRTWLGKTGKTQFGYFLDLYSTIDANFNRPTYIVQLDSLQVQQPRFFLKFDFGPIFECSATDPSFTFLISYAVLEWILEKQGKLPESLNTAAADSPFASYWTLIPTKKLCYAKMRGNEVNLYIEDDTGAKIYVSDCFDDFFADNLETLAFIELTFRLGRVKVNTDPQSTSMDAHDARGK